MASTAISTFDIANDQILNGGEIEDNRGQGRLEHADRLSKDDSDGEQYSVQTALDAIGFKWFQIKFSLVLGLFVIMDSMEMMMLSILGPILTCEWLVPTWQQAFLAMVVMAGQVVSCSFWGAFADRYGRKKAILLATSMVGYFGFLTSLSPNLVWLIVIRFLVGIAVGSCPQAMTYYSECLPTKAKATCMMVVEVFFSVGAAFEVLLAKLVVPRLGWRYLLVFSSFPAILCAILAIRMPESAAFLLAHGRYDEACKVLERMASDNGRTLPPGRLRRDKVEIGKGMTVMSDGLFSKRYRSTVILFMILGFTGGITFYGMSLLVPSLLIYADGCHGSDIVRASQESCSVSCHTFTNKDYNDIIINALADLPGIVFMTVFFAILGRRSAMSACYFCFTIAIAACNFCMKRSYLTFFLTMARAFANGISQGIFILIAEAFPTEFRALAIGLTITFAKFGGMVSPFIAQVGTAYSPYLSLSVYAVLGIVSTILPAFLPPISPRNSSLETKPIRPKSS